MKQGKNQTKIEKAQKMLSQKMAEKKKKGQNCPGKFTRIFVSVVWY